MAPTGSTNLSFYWKVSEKCSLPFSDVYLCSKDVWDCNLNRPFNQFDLQL